MKPFALVVPLFCLLLSACGPGPEPDFLEGEDVAASVVFEFLTAVREGNEAKADSLRYSRPDHIIADTERCRQLFFEQLPTGRKVLAVGRERYANEWQIYVDLKLSYGQQMKQLHFLLDPGESPKVRAVSPIVPGR